MRSRFFVVAVSVLTVAMPAAAVSPCTDMAAAYRQAKLEHEVVRQCAGAGVVSRLDEVQAGKRLATARRSAAFNGWRQRLDAVDRAWPATRAAVDISCIVGPGVSRRVARRDHLRDFDRALAAVATAAACNRRR